MTKPDPLDNIEFSQEAASEARSLSPAGRQRLANDLPRALEQFQQDNASAVKLQGTDYFSIPVAGGKIIAREIPGKDGFLVASVRDLELPSNSAPDPAEWKGGTPVPLETDLQDGAH